MTKLMTNSSAPSLSATGSPDDRDKQGRTFTAYTAMHKFPLMNLHCACSNRAATPPLGSNHNAIAIVVLILHFTGWLKRRNLEWVVLALALAVSVFPVVIFLR